VNTYFSSLFPDSTSESNPKTTACELDAPTTRSHVGIAMVIVFIGSWGIWKNVTNKIHRF